MRNLCPIWPNVNPVATPKRLKTLRGQSVAVRTQLGRRARLYSPLAPLSPPTPLPAACGPSPALPSTSTLAVQRKLGHTSRSMGIPIDKPDARASYASKCGGVDYLFAEASPNGHARPPKPQPPRSCSMEVQPMAPMSPRRSRPRSRIGNERAHHGQRDRGRDARRGGGSRRGTFGGPVASR